jgi:DNA-binding beta-propeller fold protein YncE
LSFESNYYYFQKERTMRLSQKKISAIRFSLTVLFALFILLGFPNVAEAAQSQEPPSQTEEMQLSQTLKGLDLVPAKRIARLELEQDVSQRLGVAAKPGVQDFGSLSYPNGIAIASNGKVGYITDTGNNRIVMVNNGGRVLSTWGEYGSRQGQFDLPSDAALDQAGNVYVADTMNHRIQVFDGFGKFIAAWGSHGKGVGELNGPHGIGIDARRGFAYVADTLNHRVVKFALNGKLITAWGKLGTGNGELQFPHDVAVSSDGNVFVSDFLNHRIVKYSPNGEFIAAFGSLGNQPGQFHHPWGVTVDNSDRVWVVDMSNARVEVMDINGSSVAVALRGFGDTLGRFNHPKGIGITAQGDVWIAHPGAQATDKFVTRSDY